jgi:hypothetical protein
MEKKGEKPRGEKSILCLRLYHMMIGGKEKLSRFIRGFYNVLSKGFFLTITVGSILLLLL